MQKTKRILQYILTLLGYKLQRTSEIYDPVVEKDEDFNEIYTACKDYTMTSRLRCYALYVAVKYIVNANIPGAIVECGVWRGGSTMIIAMTLKKLGVSDRAIHLYDTFEGMTEPTQEDYSNQEARPAQPEWEKRRTDEHNEWCYASLE